MIGNQRSAKQNPNQCISTNKSAPARYMKIYSKTRCLRFQVNTTEVLRNKHTRVLAPQWIEHEEDTVLEVDTWLDVTQGTFMSGKNID